MPLEISEVFSMAPLSRGFHCTEYVVPKDFDLGAGEVRLLQENLITEYENLATETNSYLDAEGRAAHNGGGLEPYQVAMDESKQSIRTIRDQIVQLMKAIYNLGHQPVPPNEAIDGDVSKILDDSKLSIGKGAATSAKAGCSQSAEDSGQRKYTLTSKCPVVSAFRSAPRSSDKSEKTSRVDPKVDGAVSRGAAARARAEAAWNARARTGGMGRRCRFC